METENVMSTISGGQNPESERVTAASQRKRTATHTKSSVSEMGIQNLTKYQLWKGMLDRILALVALVIVSPLLILIAAIIITKPNIL